eukprot:SAG11_NODE_8053_length_1065_cov_0.908903_3_plen_100_part_00
MSEAQRKALSEAPDDAHEAHPAGRAPFDTDILILTWLSQHGLEHYLAVMEQNLIETVDDVLFLVRTRSDCEMLGLGEDGISLVHVLLSADARYCAFASR